MRFQWWQPLHGVLESWWLPTPVCFLVFVRWCRGSTVEELNTIQGRQLKRLLSKYKYKPKHNRIYHVKVMCLYHCMSNFSICFRKYIWRLLHKYCSYYTLYNVEGTRKFFVFTEGKWHIKCNHNLYLHFCYGVFNLQEYLQIHLLFFFF